MAYSRREHGGIAHHFSFALLKTPKIQPVVWPNFSVYVLDFPLALPYNNAGYKSSTSMPTPWSRSVVLFCAKFCF